METRGIDAEISFSEGWYVLELIRKRKRLIFLGKVYG
jgi:hypothetical protein